MSDIDEDKLKRAVRDVLHERDKASPRITFEKVEEAVEEGIKKAFTLAGLDLSDSQAQLFAQRDHHFLRKMRRLHDAIGKYVAFAVVGIAASIVLYFASMFHKEK